MSATAVSIFSQTWIKKGYFCWFWAAGPCWRDTAARSNGPAARVEGSNHPQSIIWVIARVTLSNHTSPLLFSVFWSGGPALFAGLTGSRWTCQGSLRQVSQRGGRAAKCSQLLGRARRKLLELGPSSEMGSGASAKKEKANFSKKPLSKNLKEQGF